MIKLSLEEIIQRLPAVYGNGRYGEADAICQQALAQGACHFMLYYVKGLLCYRKGDVQQAQNLIQEAEQLNPSLAAYHHLTGLLKQRNNNDWLTIQETRLDVFQRMAQTDGYILSYPKCGRTWLRMLIGHYLGNKTPGANYFDVRDLTAGDPQLLTIDVSHDDYPHWKPVSELFGNKLSYQDKRVLFLVRDPRDVIVSYYFEYTKRDSKVYANDAGFSGSLSEFVFHPLGGLQNIVAFYNLWANNRHVPIAFELVTYESLHHRPEETLKLSLAFFGIPAIDDKRIQETVAFCQFDKMKKMEQNNQYLPKPKDDDPNSFKVRKGKVGGHKEHLSQEDIRLIDQYLTENLDDLYTQYKR